MVTGLVSLIVAYSKYAYLKTPTENNVFDINDGLDVLNGFWYIRRQRHCLKVKRNVQYVRELSFILFV